MAALLDALVLLSAVHHDAAEEGRRIIIGMTIVGLIFATIVVADEFLHWYRRDRGRGY